ncbi:hypothetical protein EXIGLDRAFT_835408 [Exidia glandulosa HHB12029]|uniref:DNA-directed DNA polymerase X domain-containing protein n=1 Tax=Exidia glandulosa HHB12029 TaxID=1314781 RepID=A0A165ISB5_EXIGL|nr:hypothetical protein EXIGLDRAFT_835408 [Exidia glandulosa HHB12029]
MKRLEAEIANGTRDKRSTVAFKQAARIFVDVKDRVRSSEDLDKVLGNSPMYDDVKRILMETLKPIEPKERARLMHEFCQLDRVGPVRAGQLVEAGIRTLQEAADYLQRNRRSSLSQLTFNSLDMVQNVSLEQAEEVLRILQDAHNPKEFEILITGRHRRGLEGAREVTLLAVHNYKEPALYESRPSANDRIQVTRRHGERDAMTKQIEDRLMWPLRVRGFTKEVRRDGSRQWACLMRLPAHPDEDRAERSEALEKNEGTYVLTAVHTVARDAVGAAMVWLTGDFAFLKKMRAAADARGYRLTKHGLYRLCAPDEEIDLSELPPAPKTPQKRKNPDEPPVYWRRVPASSELAVFEEIGEGYVDPERRNFSNVLSGTRKRHNVRRKTMADV